MNKVEAKALLREMSEKNIGAVLRYGRWWFPVDIREVIWG